MDKTNITDKLSKLGKEIEQAKSEMAQAEGQLKALNNQLQELGFENVKQAIIEMKKMKEEVITSDDYIEKGWEEIVQHIKKMDGTGEIMRLLEET